MAERDRVSLQRRDDTTLLVRFSGAWRLQGGLPSVSLVDRELRSAAQVRGVAFDAQELASWDSSVLAFLVELSDLCRQRGLDMDRGGLPTGIRRLLELAEAVPETDKKLEASKWPAIKSLVWSPDARAHGFGYQSLTGWTQTYNTFRAGGMIQNDFDPKTLFTDIALQK